MNRFMLFCLLLLTTPAFAVPTDLTFSVQPIVGYEKAVKYYPTIHYKDRLMYGARVIAGFRSIAGEAEVTRAEDTEHFYNMRSIPDGRVTVKDTMDRVKLGLRRYWGLRALSFHLRGGGQASRNKQAFTARGVTTSSTSEIKYAPYVGAGLTVGVIGIMKLVADYVVIINDVHDFRRTEYQGSAGVSFGF